MVNEKLWIKKVQEFCELANTSTKSNGATAAAIYRKIEFNFTDDDMIRAVDDMLDAEVTKLTYPGILRYLKKHKDLRINSELQRQKLKEKGETEVALTRQEIRELVNAVLEKKVNLSDDDYLRANSTIWTKDGRRLDVWIDPNDPNMEVGKALTLTYDQCGENLVRRLSIKLSMVNHKILTGRTDAARSPEDDFIPELEVPENAFQGTLNMDGRPGGHA